MICTPQETAAYTCTRCVLHKRQVCDCSSITQAARRTKSILCQFLAATISCMLHGSKEILELLQMTQLFQSLMSSLLLSRLSACLWTRMQAVSTSLLCIHEQLHQVARKVTVSHWLNVECVDAVNSLQSEISDTVNMLVHFSFCKSACVGLYCRWRS